MSPTLEDRKAEWSIWLQRADVPITSLSDFDLIGYEHHCGAANTYEVSTMDDVEFLALDAYCAGCRSNPRHPLRECEPLYRRRHERPTS